MRVHFKACASSCVGILSRPPVPLPTLHTRYFYRPLPLVSEEFEHAQGIAQREGGGDMVPQLHLVLLPLLLYERETGVSRYQQAVSGTLLAGTSLFVARTRGMDTKYLVQIIRVF